MIPPGNIGGNASGSTQPPAFPEGTWKLRLYVTGQTPVGLRALENLRRACAHWLPDRHHIEVIDLLGDPLRAVEDQILAVPMLVRMHPPPIRKIVGDLANTEQLLFDLQLWSGSARPTDEPG